MKVQVKSSFPVFYDGERYYNGETLEIKVEHFQSNVFLELEEVEEKKEQPKKTTSRKKKTEE